MTLQEWFVELSGMLDAELDSGSSIETCLEWFGNLPSEALDQLTSLAKRDSTLRDFLAVGAHLLESYEHED